jgi:hypothetical protein
VKVVELKRVSAGWDEYDSPPDTMAMRSIGCRAGQLLREVDGCAASGVVESQAAAVKNAIVRPLERRNDLMLSDDTMRSLLVDRASR